MLEGLVEKVNLILCYNLTNQKTERNVPKDHPCVEFKSRVPKVNVFGQALQNNANTISILLLFVISACDALHSFHFIVGSVAQ